MKRLLVALMGFFFVHMAMAGTYPATKVWTQNGYSCTTGTGVCQSSPESAATIFCSSLGKTPSNVTDFRPGQDRYYYQCSASGGYNSYSVLSCPNGGTLSGSTCTKTCAAGEVMSADGICHQPCGTGMTWTGNACTCDSGAQVGNDGTCCPVAGSGGGAAMQWCYVDSKAATTCDSTGNNGCKVRCNNVTFQQGTGATVQIYPKLALGQSCSYTGTKAASNTGGGALNNDELKQVADSTKDPAKAKTPEGCMAAGMGYVQSASGTTCVPSGDTGVVKKESSSNTTNDNGQQTTETKTKETTSTPTGGETKETTVKANPDGTTTTTTKTTTCKEDGTCTTSTTETTKDAAGNTTGNKTNTNQQSASEFCKLNPDSDMCKGASDACKDHPERLGCMGAGEAIEQPDLSTTEKGINAITPINISSNATCPADLPLPKGMSFSFQPFCDYASAFRPIILALAWITAGFLAFGYRGNNG